jgi:uncharacterized protein (TIGR00255 family)
LKFEIRKYAALLLSMTGFGDSRGQDDRLGVAVEVRSVNNRYFKIIVKSPERFQPLEGEIERVVRESITRGTVNVVLRVDGICGSLPYRLDPVVLKAYWQELNGLASTLGQSPPRDLSGLLALPGVVVEGDTSRADPRDAWSLIESTLRESLKKLREFRATEGASMARDLQENLKVVGTQLNEIAAKAPEIVRDFRDKLHDRVKDLLGGSEASVQPADLIREVSIFAERCDIGEEILRLRSHIDQFQEFVREPQSQGRKLEFLTQEMVREANTIGSKANNVEVAHAVVEIKSAVERIREVVQNIE